jgi:DNA-binding response OmpR family regulator
MNMRRILVIDDDELDLQTMQSLLQDSGYEVLVTADGAMGLLLFTRYHPDLVLLDQNLPGMNGLEVLRRMKRIDKAKRVIIVTGIGTEDSAEVAFRYGAHGFLRKPISGQALLDKIHAALTV